MATKYWQRLLFLAFGHGLNDFIAGYMLGSLLYISKGLTDAAIGFVIYNLLAFGGQFFAAKLLQKNISIKFFIAAAALANVAALFLFQIIPQASLILTGCASAIYHVAGGTACMKDYRATQIGVFAAPGIAGLAIAGYLAYMRVDVWNYLSVVAIVFVAACCIIHFPKGQEKQVSETKREQIIDRHDVLMILLLGIISLRSAVWNIFQIVHESDYMSLLAIAGSAFVGKILGGWISDRIGWRLYSFLSLTIAAPLITFFKEEIILFCIGIGLLQSAIPANTAMLIAYYKGQKEKGIAFSFGTAIIIGIIITMLVKLFSNYSVACFLLVLLVMFSVFLLRRRTDQTRFKGLKLAKPERSGFAAPSERIIG